MPSANPKLEKQASTEANEPIRQAITVIEHKIRNLEKRKSKLESYRDIQKNGKELNKDQKIAVAKYDEVLQTLEITRELYKQIVSIANDAAKQQKKLARKEALERTQQDISKVREVLLIQDTLMHMAGESIRESFLTGTNGASKLSEEDIKVLDNLYNEVTPKRLPETGEAPFQQQLQKSAEHLVAIIDGKSRDVIGTTYAQIKTTLQTINQSQYFEYISAAQEKELSAETKTEESIERLSDDVPVQSQAEFPAQDSGNSQDETIPDTSYPAQTMVVGGMPAPLPQTILPQGISSSPAEAPYYPASSYVPNQPHPQGQQQQQPQPPQPPRINDVIGGTPNFFFLQESELDSPDVTNQPQQIVSHIPPVNPATIPTQTYTNQNFTGVPVQPVSCVSPQQVIYTHPNACCYANANPNPPPPIPMPPSHQNNMQFSPQHPGDFTSQQAYDQQDTQPQVTEEQVENRPEEPVVSETEQSNDQTNDWSQMTDSNQIDEWVNTDVQSSGVGQEHGQTQQQSWGEQRTGGYRGRGGRRGNTNGYNGRGRGGGSFQQNGRGGQGSYYRNENSNYQNGGGGGGYQQRNYNNDGSNGGYNGGFKRERGGARGGPRSNERTGNDRGGRGGQYRGQRGSGNRGNPSGGGYIPRNKPQTQQ